jgi:DNA-binding response OmpR family regulator
MGRILIVDDDKHILDLFSLEFSESGHEVIQAESFSGLLNRVKIHQPDAIILDIKPEDIYGFNMIQTIVDHNSDLPVIIWSAYEPYMYDIKKIAADHFIAKSCDLTELKVKIEHVLDKGPIWLPLELSLFALRSNYGWKRTAANVWK